MLSEQERAQLSAVRLAERTRLLQNAKDGLKFNMERERSIGRDSIDESMEEDLLDGAAAPRSRKFLLNKINAAIERIKASTINECQDCGEKDLVPSALARPVTTPVHRLQGRERLARYRRSSAAAARTPIRCPSRWKRK